MFFSFFIRFIFFILCIDFRDREEGRERERQRNINLLFHLLLHSLVDSYSVLNGDWTLNLGVLGRLSNQLSCPARACVFLFKNPPLMLGYCVYNPQMTFEGLSDALKKAGRSLQVNRREYGWGLPQPLLLVSLAPRSSNPSSRTGQWPDIAQIHWREERAPCLQGRAAAGPKQP